MEISTTAVRPLAAAGNSVQQQYRPIPHANVSFEDEFWAPRLVVNRERTIPHIYRQLKDTGSIDAFRPDWEWPAEATRRAPWGGTPTMFWDSDVAKWLEAASYSLATHPDPGLDALVDGVIALIAGAQHADGYLNTWFTAVDPENRWNNLRDWHELYCAGHLMEAGVAHFEATGKRSLLDVVSRYADHIAATFGTAPNKARGYCGHPEIELALVKLARVTGEERYLEMSRYFVDERGQLPHYFDQEARARGEDPDLFWARNYEYNQSHCPVRQQHEVVGHAVRAVYLYCAMVDLAGAYSDAELWQTCERLWQHLTTTRMYVTGGIGTSKQNEGFTGDYDLPNESAYAETCASIGLIFWAQRMLQVECNRRYADIMELALYNGVLSSVDFEGTAFFYDNPLASRGTHHRQPWFACPCCPPNLARFFASLGQYVYAQSATDIIVHLYVQGSGLFEIDGQAIRLRQETHYPWEGAVTLRLELEEARTFSLRLRIPAWCRGARLSVNGTEVDLSAIGHGYARITRTWQPGDMVVLNLPMAVERVYAHPDVQADVGQVALRRGPLIYCLEAVDHAVPLHRIVLDHPATLQTMSAAGMPQRTVALEGAALVREDAGWEGVLYGVEAPTTSAGQITALPYYAWDNRDAGTMRVWIQAAQTVAAPKEKE